MSMINLAVGGIDRSLVGEHGPQLVESGERLTVMLIR